MSVKYAVWFQQQQGHKTSGVQTGSKLCYVYYATRQIYIYYATRQNINNLYHMTPRGLILFQTINNDCWKLAYKKIQ